MTEGSGTDNLQPLGVAGQAVHLTLSPAGSGSTGPTSVMLFDQGLIQIVQASATGLEPKRPYVLALAKAPAVARQYWEDAAANLEAIGAEEEDPNAALRRYPEVFRRSLENENRLCLGSFMAAEHDDLPAPVMQEVRTFTDVNVAWLARMLVAAGIVDTEDAAEPRARAIVASIAGAQLMARSRSDIGLFDNLIDAYREAGLLPS